MYPLKRKNLVDSASASITLPVILGELGIPLFSLLAVLVVIFGTTVPSGAMVPFDFWARLICS